MKQSQEANISFSESNDILAHALGTPEYIGRVQGKGKYYTPQKYFNSVSDHVVINILKVT